MMEGTLYFTVRQTDCIKMLFYYFFKVYPAVQRDGPPEDGLGVRRGGTLYNATVAAAAGLACADLGARRPGLRRPAG